MTETEKAMAVELMRDYADTLGNRGCNDMALPNTPDNVAMCTSMVEAFAGEGSADWGWSPPKSTNDKFYVPGADWLLVRYLAKVLEASLFRSVGDEL